MVGLRPRTLSTLRGRGRARALRTAALGCLATVLLTGCGGTRQPSTSTAADSAHSTPVQRGRILYTQDGCSGCHSLNGTRLTGPSWQDLAGSRVGLDNGHTVVADNAYLRRHIVEPQAYTVAGYPGDVMEQAIAPLELRHQPQVVAALVAFIDSLR